MAIVNNHDEMEDYLNEAVAASEGHAILIDKYIMARKLKLTWYPTVSIRMCLPYLSI